MTELPEAQQRLGKLLFDFGKHASGTAMDQYCEMAMLLARELLSDPAGWAKALGLPEPPNHVRRVEGMSGPYVNIGYDENGDVL